MFPLCLHVPPGGEGLTLHDVIEETWYLHGTKIPMQTGGSGLIPLGVKTLLGLNLSTVNEAAQRSPWSQEATQIHLQGLNSPMTAVDFRSKRDRSSL